MHTALLIIICVFAAIGFAGCVLAAMLIYAGWKIEQANGENDVTKGRDLVWEMVSGGGKCYGLRDIATGDIEWINVSWGEKLAKTMTAVHTGNFDG